MAHNPNGLKRTDTLWLRLAALEDPEFGSGVPAGISLLTFERLALWGFVHIRENGECTARPGCFDALDYLSVSDEHPQGEDPKGLRPKAASVVGVAETP